MVTEASLDYHLCCLCYLETLNGTVLPELTFLVFIVNLISNFGKEEARIASIIQCVCIVCGGDFGKGHRRNVDLDIVPMSH